MSVKDLEWMWADAGDRLLGTSLARANPFRWADAAPAAVKEQLSGKRGDDAFRGVLLRPRGAGNSGWEFATPGAAAAWIQHEYLQDDHLPPVPDWEGFKQMFGDQSRATAGEIHESVPSPSRPPKAECSVSARTRSDIGAGGFPDFQKGFAKVEGNGINVYVGRTDMRIVASMKNVAGATIVCGRSHSDKYHTLQSDDGDDQLEGEVFCKRGSQKNFEKFFAKATASHGLQLFQGGSLVSSASLTTPGGVMQVGLPKSAKKDHQYSIRIDLPKGTKDSDGFSKYIMDPGSKALMLKWVGGLRLRCSKYKIVVTLPETEGAWAAGDLRVTAALAASVRSIALAFEGKEERDRFARALNNLAASRPWDSGIMLERLDSSPFASTAASSFTRSSAAAVSSSSRHSQGYVGTNLELRIPKLTVKRAKDELGRPKHHGAQQVHLIEVTLGIRKWVRSCSFCVHEITH